MTIEEVGAAVLLGAWADGSAQAEGTSRQASEAWGDGAAGAWEAGA